MSMVDPNGDCIQVSHTGLVRVDGLPVFRTITRLDGVYVQFADSNRQRSEHRGSRFVEIRLDALISKLIG